MSIARIQQFYRAGNPLFPCHLDKKPATKGTWKGYNVANSGVINDGMLWGWEVPRGLVVVDIDDWSKWPHGDPVMTAGQKTPRGSHFVYLDPNPDGSSQEKHPWGEIRRNGTYMCIYNPSDEWLDGEFEKLPPEYAIQETGGNGLRVKAPTDYDIPAQEGSRNIKLTA